MSDRHRYFAYQATDETRIFRVDADQDGTAHGPMSRLIDGQWQGTVYASLARFLAAQVLSPREITAAQLTAMRGEVQ